MSESELGWLYYWLTVILADNFLTAIYASLLQYKAQLDKNLEVFYNEKKHKL